MQKNTLLKQGNLAELFNLCGWNNPQSNDVRRLSIGSDETAREFVFREVARLHVRALVCDVDVFPTYSERAALDSKLRRGGETYVAVFRDHADFSRQLWMVPVQTVERRKTVVVPCETEAQRSFLNEKIDRLSFPIGKTPGPIDVIEAIEKAFLVNSDAVTQKFYAEFQKHHKAFAKAIIFEGSTDPTENEEAIKLRAKERDQYASVMLDRLMFCYFVQKKRFIDNDLDYLARKLREVQAKRGPDHFYGTFYKCFLRALFSDGLNTPLVKRTKTFKRDFGLIPYLNGGLFASHRLEEKYNIDIPDEVFENLFAFFDKWQWHLDTRLTSDGNDINPDVLGYIFEKYINERAAMGAYYTKEDITEYIGRNTIVPWLLEKTLGGRCLSSLQSLLASNPDRYIFPAMRKGVDLDLPPEIEKGVAVEPLKTLRVRRAEWNRVADEAFALPTEIWRETVARRQRYQDVRAKLTNGEIRDINDFTTYNLDIRAFAEDAIRQSSDPTFVRHFYKALRKVTVLDPTCGSGAFLFAAMNILEPLYEVCLDRMEEFNAENPKLFEDDLAELRGAFRSNRQHFIYKSIILRNLYGVDIMPEAVEIAKLRLFLKMVAVVDADFTRPEENYGLDPLPDIDFNIRCGNTLVGYASDTAVETALNPTDRLLLDGEEFKKVTAKATDVSAVFSRFRDLQLDGGDTTEARECKKALQKKLNALNAQLDKTLANTAYSVNVGDSVAFAAWKASHQPFHWYSEFYDIIVGRRTDKGEEERGGFDIIIGNPPYVSMKKIDYLKNTANFSCPDLYGHVIRRSLELLSPKGRHGFIVMHNLAFNDEFNDVRNLLLEGDRSLWCSFYARIPSGLFSGNEGARVRNCIYLTANAGAVACTTRLHRWFTEYRPELFANIHYCSFKRGNVLPMINFQQEEMVFQTGTTVASLVNQEKQCLMFRGAGYNWLTVTLNAAPCYDDNREIPATNLKTMKVPKKYFKALLLLFNGKITLARWLTYGDEFNVTLKPFMESRVNFDSMKQHDVAALEKLYDEFASRLPDTLQFKLNCGKRIGTYNISKLWDITDKSDAIFLKYLFDNPIEVQEAIEDHVTSCVISGRKDGADDEE